MFGFFVFLKKESKTENTDMKEVSSVRNEDETIVEMEKNDTKNNLKGNEESDRQENIPDSFLIDVPFTSQAPFGKWDEMHEEACEEASVIMVKYFLDKKNLLPQIAEDEIKNLVKFQIKNYGDYKDGNAEQTAKLYSDFYGHPRNGLKMKVIYDFNKDDLKKYLSRGNPIIVPAAGRLLGNPNFTAPGPLYHNLVLIGYEGNNIITNDPGTKRGERYKYDINTLFNAIHDFTGKKKDIEKGRKAMIVLE